MAAAAQGLQAAPSSSLGQLLLDLTAQVQDERRRRGDVEQRNHALLLELDQLQRDVLELKTALVSVPAPAASTPSTRRRHSVDWTSAGPDSGVEQLGIEDAGSDDAAAAFWSRELLEARRAKEKAAADAHARALQVLELSACVSMQHDELAALRSQAAQTQEALASAEAARAESERERELLAQEKALLAQDVARLSGELGARGAHAKALLEKWTEAQAQSEHLEREAAAAAAQLSDTRRRADELAARVEQLADEREALQHQVTHLKAAVAAKAAESKAFQAVGASARDHAAQQHAALARHAVVRRKLHGAARDARVALEGVRAALKGVRAPLEAFRADCPRLLARLRGPVLELAGRAQRFAGAAHAERAPMREALLAADAARRHLLEQLWRARRHALLAAQVQQPALEAADSEGSQALVVRAHYGSGELLLREQREQREQQHEQREQQQPLRVRCDALYSDRARAWTRHESLAPVLRAVLDGGCACVATVAGAADLVVGSDDDRGAPRRAAVPELALAELFAALGPPTPARRARLSLSCLAVFNESVFDLLALEGGGAGGGGAEAAGAAGAGLVVLEVADASEALLVLRGAREALAQLQQRGALQPELTHTVVTACLALDDRLAAPSAARAKLQLVELALPIDEDCEDRDRVRARVAAAAGVQALSLALAEVRRAREPAAVRYHGAKLTVLLQDTLRARAKFLALVALPAQAPSGSRAALRAAAAVRWLQQLRAAVGDGSGDAALALASSGAGARDRSLETFMSRLALLQPPPDEGGDAGAALAFSSPEMQELDAASRRGRGAAPTWQSELDAMARRYGGRDALDELAATPSPPPSPQHHQQLAMTASDDTVPPPVPISTTMAVRPLQAAVTPVKAVRRPSGGDRKSGGRHASWGAASLKARKKVLVRAASAAATYTATATVNTAVVASPNTRLRRETASSALKKARALTLQPTRSPFR